MFSTEILAKVELTAIFGSNEYFTTFHFELSNKTLNENASRKAKCASEIGNY